MSTVKEPDSTSPHDLCSCRSVPENERARSCICAQCSQTVVQLTELDLRSETRSGASAPDLPGDVPRTTDVLTTEAEGVSCDACAADSRRKALSSCLVCLSSYCDTHLRLHDELHARAAHTVVAATSRLRAMTCAAHGKVREVYCREDRRRICCACMLEDHKGHDVVAAGHEGEEIRKMQERRLKELRLARNTLQDVADATEEECERLFTELIRSMGRSQGRVQALIRDQERAELGRIDELMKRAEEEITKQNDIHVLQGPAQGLRSGSLETSVPKTTVNPQFSFGEAVKSMSALRNRIERVWQSEISQISAAVLKDRIVAPAGPRTRKDFLQYLVPLTLAPDTAHWSLSIRQETRVECNTEWHPYPNLPERFDWWAQVLCREPLSGRCYWEVEWTGSHGVDVAVSYKDVPRKGDDDECSFGYNRRSWNLDCAVSRYTFAHDGAETEISAPVSHRVGVYLDHQAGALSFYSVSDCMALLHRAETRFTQPLYAGFGLFEGSALRICQPDRGT